MAGLREDRGGRGGGGAIVLRGGGRFTGDIGE
jgi:hypothetical protein